MDTIVAESATDLENAIKARSPEMICTAARILRASAYGAKECYLGAWTTNESDRTRNLLENALIVLGEIQNDPGRSEDEKSLSRFSWCRVYSRLADLFPETAAKYELQAKECDRIVAERVAAAARE
ncbi:MAG TPA: hypothetical protein PK082_04245 [Phycisphaerae bacterium]|nr:hypothetical protein [Phycisphaerae bacterium]